MAMRRCVRDVLADRMLDKVHHLVLAHGDAQSAIQMYYPGHRFSHWSLTLSTGVESQEPQDRGYAFRVGSVASLTPSNAAKAAAVLTRATLSACRLSPWRGGSGMGLAAGTGQMRTSEPGTIATCAQTSPKELAWSLTRAQSPW